MSRAKRREVVTYLLVVAILTACFVGMTAVFWLAMQAGGSLP